MTKGHSRDNTVITYQSFASELEISNSMFSLASPQPRLTFYEADSKIQTFASSLRILAEILSDLPTRRHLQF